MLCIFSASDSESGSENSGSENVASEAKSESGSNESSNDNHDDDDDDDEEDIKSEPNVSADTDSHDGQRTRKRPGRPKKEALNEIKEVLVIV